MVMKSIGALLLGKKSNTDILGSILGSVIALAILLFLGEYLWNNVLVKIVSVAKPITSIWQVLGLKLLLGLFLC